MGLLLAQTLINGILLGGIYLLAAVGLHLVFGVLRIVNLAHGDFVMLGAYAAYFAATQLRVPQLLMLPVNVALGLGIGILIYFSIMDRLRRSEETTWLLVTFGLSAAIVGVSRYVFGPQSHFLNLYSGSYFVGPIYLPKARLIAFMHACALTGTLWYVLRSSRVGKAIRAIASNAELAIAMGLPTRLLLAGAFSAGTILAVVAGSLLISVYAVDPEVGVGIVFKSFAILALAGFRGALAVGIAALLLGAGEALLSLWIPQSAASLLAFVALFGVIMIRPPEVLALRGPER